MIKKIAQITDLHLDEMFPFKDHRSARKRFDLVLEDIETEQVDQIICTGDIGENKGIQYFFKRLGDKNLSIVLGNHDKFHEVSRYYETGVDYHSKKIYHSISEGLFKFIFLDSSEGFIDDKQLVWLENELITFKPIIVFIHHPVIGLDLKVDEIGRLKNRQKVLDLLSETNSELTIYCGHYHMESSLTYKNVTQYITPAISYQIEKNSDTIEIDTTVSGYRIIQIEGDQLSSKVKILNNAD